MAKQTLKARRSLKKGSLRRKTPAHPSCLAMPRAVESGPVLLRRLGTDAAAWCAEMVKLRVVKADPAPGGDFHGWMCNAIMYAGDTGYSQKCREVREQEAARRGREMVWHDIERPSMMLRRKLDEIMPTHEMGAEQAKRASELSLLSRIKAWCRR